MRRIGRIICMVMFTMYCASSDGAVVQRTNTYTTTTTTTGGTVSAANRPTTAARTNFVSTAPVIVSSADSNQGDDTSEPENPEPIEEETEDQIIIENKTSQFDIVLNSYGASTGEDTSSSELEALIRQQRAALDTQDSLNLTTNYFQQGNNTCDLDLRKCMQNKCGDDFTGCSGDTDTSWGNKMDSCRRDTECTGEEFSAFAADKYGSWSNSMSGTNTSLGGISQGRMEGIGLYVWNSGWQQYSIPVSQRTIDNLCRAKSIDFNFKYYYQQLRYCSVAKRTYVD